MWQSCGHYFHPKNAMLQPTTGVYIWNLYRQWTLSLNCNNKHKFSLKKLGMLHSVMHEGHIEIGTPYNCTSEHVELSLFALCQVKCL